MPRFLGRSSGFPVLSSLFSHDHRDIRPERQQARVIMAATDGSAPTELPSSAPPMVNTIRGIIITVTSVALVVCCTRVCLNLREGMDHYEMLTGTALYPQFCNSLVWPR